MMQSKEAVFELLRRVGQEAVHLLDTPARAAGSAGSSDRGAREADNLAMPISADCACKHREFLRGAVEQGRTLDSFFENDACALSPPVTPNSLPRAFALLGSLAAIQYRVQRARRRCRVFTTWYWCHDNRRFNVFDNPARQFMPGTRPRSRQMICTAMRYRPTTPFNRNTFY